ncbi:hypothetical protein [Mycobacterium sp. 1465703.0]|uniref:hypothetical protein n=1 Tax=Mycobacterium sp. 1465703.0 TaxID=1834078 RepID=UPI000AB6F41C|nr:hypothetical protein [Mycobacterium sp. 1465703.0]
MPNFAMAQLRRFWTKNNTVAWPGIVICWRSGDLASFRECLSVPAAHRVSVVAKELATVVAKSASAKERTLVSI